MRPKTKILIVSESPLQPTGMAEVIRLIFVTLLDNFPDQYELHQVGLFQSHCVATSRWPLYPTRRAIGKMGVPLFLIADANGEITFREVVSKVRPDIVFAFNDTQRVLHLCCAPEDRPYKLVLYVNLDGFPAAPDQGPVLNQADLVVTMSEFSSRVALACLPGLNPAKLHHMYSPADTARFRPVSAPERLDLRKRCFPDWMPRDAFLLGWIGRNQWRKQVWVLYEVIHFLRSGDYLLCRACDRVSLLRPPPLSRKSASSINHEPLTQIALPADRCQHCHSTSVDVAQPLADVFLWLHMPDEPTRQDWQRSWLENHFAVKPGRDIHYTEGHSGDSFKRPAEMATFYQAWDCLLYLSGGEGFGLPAWEAMCSALPVVYTNYSSHAEFLGKALAGLAVGGTLQPEPETCIMRMIADVPQVIEAVRKLYFDRKSASAFGMNGRSFSQAFSLSIQSERWHHYFQQLLSLKDPKRENARFEQ